MYITVIFTDVRLIGLSALGDRLHRLDVTCGPALTMLKVDGTSEEVLTLPLLIMKELVLTPSYHSPYFDCTVIYTLLLLSATTGGALR